MHTSSLAPLVAALALTYNETEELFKRLRGGTAGFNVRKHKIAELRGWLETWHANGTPHIEAHAVAIIAERAAKSAPAMPAPPAHVTPPAGVVTLPPLTHPLAPAIVHAPAAPQPSPVVLIGDLAPEQGETLRDSILAAIALTSPVEPAPAQPEAAQPFDASPPPALPPAILAPATLPDGTPGYDSQAEADAIAAALALTAQTHPAAVLPTNALAMPPATPGKRYARELFADQPAAILDAIPADLMVPVFSHPDAEAINPHYRFNPAILHATLICMATAPTMRAWFGGPRGTGKTEFARQIAARTGRAFYRVNFNRHTEASEIIGDMGLKSGNTDWVDGPVSLAAREPDGAAVLLLDEPTYCAPGSLSSMNPILERDGATLRLPRTGERLPIHRNLFICGADNTFGTGDVSGEYHGRHELGADTRDRFNVKLTFSYLPEKEEKALLRDAVMRETGKRPSATMLTALLKIIHVAREKANIGELQGAPSFRGASAFATLLAYGMAPEVAYTMTIVTGAPEESHEALRQIFAAHWPTNATGALASFFEGV